MGSEEAQLKICLEKPMDDSLTCHHFGETQDDLKENKEQIQCESDSVPQINALLTQASTQPPAEIEEQISTFSTENTALQSQNHSLELENHSLELELSMLKNQHELGELQKKLNTNKKKIKILEQSNLEEESHREQLEKKVSALRSNSQAKVNSKPVINASKENVKNKSNAELSSLQEALSSVKSKITQEKNKEKKLLQKLKELEEQEKLLQREKHKIQSLVKDIDAQKKKQHMELKKSTMLLNTLQHQTTKLKENRIAIKERMATPEFQELRRLQKDYADIMEYSPKRIEELYQVIHHETETIQIVQEQNKSLLADLRQLEEETTRKDADVTIAEIQEITANIKEIHAKIEARENEYKATLAKKKQIKRQLCTAENLNHKNKTRQKKNEKIEKEQREIIPVIDVFSNPLQQSPSQPPEVIQENNGELRISTGESWTKVENTHNTVQKISLPVMDDSALVSKSRFSSLPVQNLLSDSSSNEEETRNLIRRTTQKSQKSNVRRSRANQRKNSLLPGSNRFDSAIFWFFIGTFGICLLFLLWRVL